MAEKKPNALQTKLTPSAELGAVVGTGPIARGECVSKMWEYIKKNDLQNPANKREILADAKLKPIFGGKDKVSMFEMNKHLAGHLK
ncbi:SWIB/MDM2 domain-containing protein [Sphingoaurantiacus capsulatus]|uniref:SWIB/MDM2 domain-containing protein n=1 Tax=Sphingoaurantiacus capsulatus TaxID=1771310 RepID=A0ABV7X6U1_9SPHN